MGREIEARGAILVAGLMAGLAAGSSAQESGPELNDLPDTRGATMSFKLEKTILKVDVLNLTVRVDETTAVELSRLVDRESKYRKGMDETVASTVVEAGEAIAHIDFLRGIRLDQFLEGVDEDLGRAVRAGWVDQATFDEVTTGLREWFAFLETRGIRKGDRLVYRMRGDELRTTYRGVGETGLMLDQTDVGPNYVMAFWGGYYAPRTSFREGLVRSLWESR